jgi:RNA polymerase sigma-70 factor (ECF subfamily)
MPLLGTRPPPIPPEARRVRPAAVPPPVPAHLRATAAPPPVPPEARRPRADAPTEVLVDAARRGDGRAFNHLVRRYRPRILALGLHLTGSRSDAEDVAQDAFLRAFQALPEFEGRSAFFTWVYRIAVNRALQLRAARRARPITDLNDPRVSLAVAVDCADAPGRALELRETYAQLVAAFDQLSPLLRTTVALVTLQGLSHPEVAAVMDSTEGTIAWRMHEARAQLRRALGLSQAEQLAAARKSRAPSTEGVTSDSLTVRLAFALAAVL